MQILEPAPGSGSVSVRQGLRMCVSNVFPGAAAAAGQDATHWEPLRSLTLLCPVLE